MSLMDTIFGQVESAVRNHASPNTPGPAFDPNPLLGALQGILGGALGGGGQQQGGTMQNPLSSDQDPYGDPGLQGGAQNANYGNVRSSDQDPYGDPGLQGGGQNSNFGNVKSSDQDPYGDPGRR